MPGKIRILADRLDEVVGRKSHQYGLSKKAAWEVRKCQCSICKKIYPPSKYTYPGRTFKQKIERSLEGMEWKCEREGDFFVYTW